MTTIYLLLSQVDHRLVQWAKGFTYCWNIITLTCICKKALTCIMCLQGLDMHQQIKICVYKAQTGICQTRFVSGRQRLVSARLRHASAGTDFDLQMCTFPGSHTKRQKTGATMCAYTAHTLWEHQAWWSNLPYLWAGVSVKDQEVSRMSTPAVQYSFCSLMDTKPAIGGCFMQKQNIPIYFVLFNIYHCWS